MRWMAMLLALSLVWMLVGCGPASLRQPTAAPPTRSPNLVRLLTTTPIPTSTPTATPTPTPTARPTTTPTCTPTPLPLTNTLNVEPAQVEPGHTLLIRLYSPLALTATFFLDDQVLPSFPGEGIGQRLALAGISVWAAEGPHVVSAVLRDFLGQVSLLTTTVEVLPANFPVEYVTLLPGRDSLLDPQLVEDEWARVKPVLEEVSGERLWDGPFITPTVGEVSSPFGSMRSYNGAAPSSYHNGLDISAMSGTVVLAPARGRVVMAEEMQVRGNAIILDHGWGVHSGYFHLSAIGVSVGQVVEQGQEIGRVGGTGLVSGYHLHWEIRVGLIPVDPSEWVQRAVP